MVFEELHDRDAVVSLITDPVLLGQQLGDTIFLAVGLNLFDVDHFATFLVSSVDQVEPYLSNYQREDYDNWVGHLPVKVRHPRIPADSFPIATKKVSSPVEVVDGARTPPYRAFRGDPSISSRCS